MLIMQIQQLAQGEAIQDDNYGLESNLIRKFNNVIESNVIGHLDFSRMGYNPNLSVRRSSSGSSK